MNTLLLLSLFIPPVKTNEAVAAELLEPARGAVVTHLFGFHASVKRLLLVSESGDDRFMVVHLGPWMKLRL